MMRGLAGLLGLAALCLAASAGIAGTWTVAGLSFSDELGGLRLLAASGRGTRDDPIVLVEEITGAGPAVLVVTNHRNGGELLSPANGFLALSVVKIVLNRGPWRWSGFDLELRALADRPSLHTDGLSFDQPQILRRPAHADRFARSRHEDEPFDLIRFEGGGVEPRDRLRLHFDIVDANGRPRFYLVQRPVVLIAAPDLRPLPQLAAAPAQGLAAR